MGLQGEAVQPSEIEWYLWGIATATTLAALEVRALRSNNRYATLSSVARRHARRSVMTKTASTAVFAGVAVWWTNHIVWAELDRK